MPADHLIKDLATFNETVLNACILTEHKGILTFGIVPDHPETGYGYIRKGDNLVCSNESTQAYKLAEFVEKPDNNKVQQYLDSGDYLWNSGIFMMQGSTWLEAIEKYRLDILSACKTACDDGSRDGIFFRLNNNAFTDCPEDSIDYAVMEKLTDSDQYQAVVVALDAGWSDIGSWSSVFEQREKTADN